MSQLWKNCSSCKAPINFSGRYYECSVSTCTGRRTGYVFCSVPCWEIHLPGARHKDAYAIEEKAPSSASTAGSSARNAAPSSSSSPATFKSNIITKKADGALKSNQVETRASITTFTSHQPASKNLDSASRHDILIVASKLKAYVKARGGDMNTSSQVMTALSDIVRDLCDDAILNAKSEGRKTLLDRDF